MSLSFPGGEDRSTANARGPADRVRPLRGGSHRQETQTGAGSLATPQGGAHRETIQVLC